MDAFGFVTAHVEGTATITVSTPDREPVQVPVTVDQIPTTLEVTPTSIVLQAGGVQPLTVRVLDGFGTPIPDAGVAFSSGDAGVASVSIGGLVRAEADGSTIITVTSGTLTATVGTFVGEVPPGVILQHVVVEGSTWGVRTKGDRYLVTGPSAFLHAGQGTGFGFSQAIPVAGLTLDVDLITRPTVNWAYVVSAQDPGGAEAVAVVDLDAGEVIDFVEGSGQNLYAVALSPDEEFLFLGTGSGAERVSLTTGQVTVLGGVTGSVTVWGRHPTLARLYGNMGYGSVVEIDSETGNVLRTFTPTGIFSPVQSTAVSPDGTRLYAAIEGGDLLSWDLETGAAGPRLTGGGGFGLAVSPDGKVLYVARGTEVLLVDRASLTLLKTVEVGGSTRRVGVRGDGVAVVGNEGGWVDFIK